MKYVWFVYIAGIIGIFGVASARGWGGGWLPGIVVWVIGGAFLIRAIELRKIKREERDAPPPDPD